MAVDRERMRRWALILAAVLLGGCTEAEDTRPPLSSCSFFEARQCWQCGTCDRWEKTSIGCLAENECVLFCGDCRARDYQRCLWGDHYPEQICRDWIVPKGTIDGCKGSCCYGDPQWGIIKYSCTFCPWPGLKFGLFTRGKDGTCAFFYDSTCIASGYEKDESCDPRRDAGRKNHDGGPG
jgi:hypothetical protein